MNDKLLSMLGLCRRAGTLIVGNDIAEDSVINGKAVLVIAAGDASQNTVKKLFSTAHMCNVKTLVLNRTKDELGVAVGKYCAVAAIVDAGFAKKVAELAKIESEQEDANDKV